MAYTTFDEHLMKYEGGIFDLTKFSGLNQYQNYTTTQLSEHGVEFGEDSLVDKTILNNLSIGEEWSFWKFSNASEFILKKSGTNAVNIGFKSNGVATWAFIFSQASFFLGSRVSYLTIADNGSGKLFICLLQSNDAHNQWSATNFGGTDSNQDTYVRNMIEGAIPPPEYHNGAGSGYIGNTLLSEKKMVGYNVPTSDTASTKTESVETFSATPTADTPKAGNGFARITFLRGLE